MRLCVLGLMALGLLATITARAGDIFYGYNDPSSYQIIRMDENGANAAALFPPGVANEADARMSDISHTSYATTFAQGRMWLCVPQQGATTIYYSDGGSDLFNEAYVFAKSPTGQPVYRQVTDFLADGFGAEAETNDGHYPRWAVNDGFVSCQVEDLVNHVSYLVRISVTGDEIAADNFVPITWHDPANPGTLNPRIEILLKRPWYTLGSNYIAGWGHTWNFEGTRLAYSSDVGWRVKTVGPLGTFTGSTDETLDPVLLDNKTASAQEPVRWRPVAGSDQLVFYGWVSTKSGTTAGICYAYANTLTHALFIQNGKYDPKTKTNLYYHLPTWSADGSSVVMQDGYQLSNPPGTWYICKVPTAGGTVVRLTPISTTARLYLYGAR